MARMRIGDMLVKAGLIDEMQLQSALAHQRQWGGRIGDILIDRGLLDEMMLWRGLARQLGVPLVSLPELRVAPDVVRQLPPEMCQRLELIPLARDDRTITIATADPSNVAALDEVAFRTSLHVKPVVAPSREIEWAIRAWIRHTGEACPPPRTRKAPAAGPAADPAMNTRPFAATAPGTAPGLAPPMGMLGSASTPILELARASTPGVRREPQLPPGFTPARGIAIFSPPGASAEGAPVPGPGVPLEEQLREANALLYQLVELCIAHGVFTREELLARLRRAP